MQLATKLSPNSQKDPNYMIHRWPHRKQQIPVEVQPKVKFRKKRFTDSVTNHYVKGTDSHPIHWAR